MVARPVRAMLVTLMLLMLLVPILYRWDGAQERASESTAPPPDVDQGNATQTGDSLPPTRVNATAPIPGPIAGS